MAIWLCGDSLINSYRVTSETILLYVFRNILFSRKEFRVAITDFGLASKINSDTIPSKMAVRWASPEAWRYDSFVNEVFLRA